MSKAVGKRDNYRSMKPNCVKQDTKKEVKEEDEIDYVKYVQEEYPIEMKKFKLK